MDIEISLNLWYRVDGNSKLVTALGGRGYVIDGSDDERLAILRRLARTDFALAIWLPVPRSVAVVTHDVSTGGSYEDPGTLTLEVLHAMGIGAFESVLRQIEREESIRGLFNYAADAALSVKIPLDPLSVMTALYETEEAGVSPQV